jgi:hypothetical protein
VIEMQIAADAFARHNVHMRAGHRGPASYLGRGQREERKAARAAKRERRAEKKARRLPTLNAPKALETPESASGGSATN